MSQAHHFRAESRNAHKKWRENLKLCPVRVLESNASDRGPSQGDLVLAANLLPLAFSVDDRCLLFEAVQAWWVMTGQPPGV